MPTPASSAVRLIENFMMFSLETFVRDPLFRMGTSSIEAFTVGLLTSATVSPQVNQESKRNG
jgi:hypothetical protein